MFRALRNSAIVLISLVLAIGGMAKANWFETFDGDELDLPTWVFSPYPDLTKTFTHTIITDPNGNKYLSLDETSSAGLGGSQFGAAFGSDEEFTDVRVGAIFNVTGDASHHHHGLIARTTYFVDDGSVSGAPGMVATQTYVMHVNWEGGPANLRLDIEKVVMLQNIMRNEDELGLDIYAPGLNHARSYYAELDIVGSGPVYITGSIYEYKGGPLVAQVSMVDTNGNDPWEEEVDYDAVFKSGVSGIFGQNQRNEPAGYHCTFDDVFSVSDGPAAVNPSPANGAAEASVDVTLSWLEAEFATGRELWFGKAGAMEKIATPSGETYTPGTLEFGQVYEWRVDQIGASGIVTGHTWTFTTASYLTVEDFESYNNNADIQAAWPHNIEGFDYVFLAADNPADKSMRLYYQNQYEPFFTETTRTFAGPQDWTRLDAETLSLSFAGQVENVEQLMYLKVEDAAGNSGTIEHPYRHATQARLWHDWTVALLEISAAGVDLTQVSKLAIGLGEGTPSNQADEDLDSIYIDDIRLYPAQ